MEKRWVYKPQLNDDVVEQLAQNINVSNSIASLLLQRNIYTFEDAKQYFRPSLNDLHDPFLMRDMDKAVWRIEEAIRKKEKILIYGDYDVDGTTSVALVMGFLRQFYNHLAFYTPDRYAEGYGVSMRSIDWAKENGFSLIISLDCGIKAMKPIAYAKDLGIDFIVCDHHLPSHEMPPAFAVLDPKRPDCDYPYKELSGCGVGFKLLHAFSLSNDLPIERLFSFLDLLAVSIAADIVPITGENRIFMYYGLQKLNTHPRPGIKALIDIATVKGDIDVSTIVFGIAPRINAVGRVTHAIHAIKLLLAENQDEAKELADFANDNNLERRTVDSSITQEALEMLEKQMPTQAKSSVLYKESWSKGVIGIVASRCVEKFYRPTIILTQSDGKAAGSARSVANFDIYEAIAECADLLDQYGGHKYAAGLSMPLDNLAEFKIRFENAVAKNIRPEDLIPHIDVDLKLDFDQISGQFYNIVKQMSPFGPLNMQPVFVSENITTENVRLLKEAHLKFTARQGYAPTIDAIAFSRPEYFDLVNSGKPFNLCYSIQENNYMGRTTLQLLVRDIRMAE